MLTRQNSAPLAADDDRVQHRHQVLLPPDKLQIVKLGLDPGDDIYDEIKEVSKADASLQPFTDACQRGDKRLGSIRLNGVRVQDGVLYRDRRLWVPED